VADKSEFEAKFWKSLRSDMTAMLSVGKAEARPMTAQFDGDRKTIYFFTGRDTDLGSVGMRAKSARLTYASKGHDLFASVDGMLKEVKDKALVDRLWNRFVAAWFEKGKDDPKVVLLAFEPGDAHIWKDASSLVAGVKLFLGMGDPKKDYRDKVAEVRLG